MKRIFVASLLFSTLLCVNVYGYDIRVDKQGWFDDEFHWEMITDTDKYGTGMSGCGRGLKVNGIIVIPCQNYAMDTVTIGNSLYFKVKRSKGEHYELFDIVGERVIPFKFNLIEKGGTDGNLDGLYEFCTIDDGIHRQHLCDSKLNLIKSGYDGYAKRIDVEGYNGYFITIPSGTSGTSELYDSNLKLLKSGFSRASDKKIEGRNETYLELTYHKDNGYEQELYTTDMKMVFPRYRYLWQKNDSQGNFQYWHIEDCYGHKGRLDKGWNWIVSLDKGFSEIYEETISGVNYYKCKRGDYWGLFDTKFNEVIPPDYEDLDYFAGTNYVKFKLNGFWGVMTLQGKVTKTIIPTTRGYTDISRYVKSQKRFTYEMNGYKGECNHLGQQVSKIKVNTPNSTTTAASSYSSSSSSSNKSSSTSSSSSRKSTSGNTAQSKSSNTDPGLKYAGTYTESPQGYHEEAGRYTDGIGGGFEKDVKIYDDKLIVFGTECPFLRTSGSWRIYKDPIILSGESFYYVDENFNMKKVQRVPNPFGGGTDTFTYSMQKGSVKFSILQNQSGGYGGGTVSGGSGSSGSTGHRCRLCNGTGRKISQVHPGNSTQTKWCNECRKRGHTGHFHTNCDLCGGSGWTK